MERLTNIGSNGEIWITDNDETRRIGRKESAYKKLAEYEDLEEQGLLLKLICKIGNVIWDNDYGKPCAYTITGLSFGEADSYIDEPVAIDDIVYYYSNSNGSITGSFASNEIGKSVFLSLEDAEQALKKSKWKNYFMDRIEVSYGKFSKKQIRFWCR